MNDSKRVTREGLARAIQHVETPIGSILPPIDPFLDRATAIFDALPERFIAHEPDEEHGSDPHVIDTVSGEVVDFITMEEAIGSAAEYEENFSIFQQARPEVEAAIRAEGLDVERLARALIEVDVAAVGDDIVEWWRPLAALIAAEYARLGAER